MVSRANNPIDPATVKAILHITIPILIHSIRPFFSAPKAIPTAAPSGAPKIRGDSKPRPIIPYLFHKLYIRVSFNAVSSPYFHFTKRALRFSPKMVMAIAESIAPVAEKMMISTGLISITRPKGMPSHSSTTLAAKTIKIDSRFIVSLSRYNIKMSLKKVDKKSLKIAYN